MTDEKQEPQETKEQKRDILKEAREIAERIERSTAEYKTLVERNEELAARSLLGGRTDAGTQPPEPRELTPKEYAQKALRGELKFSS